MLEIRDDSLSFDVQFTIDLVLVWFDSITHSCST